MKTDNDETEKPPKPPRLVRIMRANKGDVLKTPHGNYIVVGGAWHETAFNGTVTNELNQRFHYNGMYEDEMEQVFPPALLVDGARYKPTVVFDAYKNPTKLLLAEIDGTCPGYRHQFPISDYGISLNFSTPSTDPRVGRFSVCWHCRSGQFWTKVVKAQTWTMTLTDKGTSLHLDFGTSWIDVPAQ